MADLNSTIVRGNLRVTDDENVNGNLKVGVDVVGASTSNKLIFRHLDGQNCNGDYNLYLQYHQPNTRIYLNGSTYYIENGYYFNGISEQANLINPHQNVSSTGRSTWDPTSSGKIIWGQKFANNTISNDTGDLTLFLRPSVYGSGATELCMNIDGDYYSMGNKIARIVDLPKTNYTTNGKNYQVAKDRDGNLYVNVPWTDTNTDTDTKNTAGSTNSASKLFLVGAASQAANPQTYSYSTVYATAGTLNATKFTVDAEHTGGTIQYNAANGCMEIIC